MMHVVLAKKQAEDLAASARAEIAKVRDDAAQQLKVELEEKRVAAIARLEAEENERRAIMEAAKAGEWKYGPRACMNAVCVYSLCLCSVYG